MCFNCSMTVETYVCQSNSTSWSRQLFQTDVLACGEEKCVLAFYRILSCVLAFYRILSESIRLFRKYVSLFRAICTGKNPSEVQTTYVENMQRRPCVVCRLIM